MTNRSAFFILTGNTAIPDEVYQQSQIGRLDPLNLFQRCPWLHLNEVFYAGPSLHGRDGKGSLCLASNYTMESIHSHTVKSRLQYALVDNTQQSRLPVKGKIRERERERFASGITVCRWPDLGYWDQRADERHGNPPQGNQQPLVVKNKAGRPPMSLGWASPCNVKFFPSVLWHHWLGNRKDMRPVKKVGCWFVAGDDLTEALCTSYSSSCHHHFHHP